MKKHTLMKKHTFFALVLSIVAVFCLFVGACGNPGGNNSSTSETGSTSGSTSTSTSTTPPEETIIDYTEEHYFETLFGEFKIDNALTQTGSAMAGDTVSATIATKTGFVFDENNAKNAVTVTLSTTNNTLKVYYTRVQVVLTIEGETTTQENLKFGESFPLDVNDTFDWVVTNGDAVIENGEVVMGIENSTVTAVSKNKMQISPSIFTNVNGGLTATLNANATKQGIVFLYNLPRTQNLINGKTEYFEFYTAEGKAYLVKNVDGEETVLDSCDVTLVDGENKYSVSYTNAGIICSLNDTQVLTYETSIVFGGRAGVYLTDGYYNINNLTATGALSLQEIKEYAVYVMATLEMPIYKVAYSTLIEKENGKFFADAYGELQPIIAQYKGEVGLLETLDEITNYMVEEGGALQKLIALSVSYSSMVLLSLDLVEAHLYPYISLNKDGSPVTATTSGNITMSSDILSVDGRWYVPNAYSLSSQFGQGLLSYFYDAVKAVMDNGGDIASMLAVGDSYVVDVTKAVMMYCYEFYYWYCRNNGKTVYSEWWYLWTYIGAANSGYQYNGSVENFIWPGDWRLPKALYGLTSTTDLINSYLWMVKYQTVNLETITYDVNFVLNGGEGVEEVVTTNAVAAYTLPTPTKEGAEFAGWYLTRFFYGNPITEVPFGNTNDYTVYAKWNETLTETVTVNEFFGDYMVLPRDKKVKVWGEGTNGVEVTVKFANQTKTATVVDGKWAVELDALTASFEGQTLTVEGGSTKYAFRDILVGELWLGAGQSNMEYWIIWHGMNYVGDFSIYNNYDKVRLYRQKVSDSEAVDPDLVDNRWLAMNNDRKALDALSESSYGLAFILELQELLNVPVGMVVSSRGATYIEEWLSEENNEKLGSTIPEEKGDIASRFYNGMTTLLEGIPFDGVLWRHGGNNNEYPDLYVKQFGALREQYIELFGNQDLPIIISQKVQYAYMQRQDFRLMEWELMEKYDNVYTVCSIDQGDWYDVHPADRIPTGSRAANVVAKYVYGIEEATGLSAYPVSFEVNGENLIINFKDADMGFVAMDVINGFEVAGEDGVFTACAAEISGNTIVLKGVANAKQVRYLYASTFNFPVLFTQNGLPVAPFWFVI